MVSIKFILLAAVLLAAVQADAASKHRPGKKRHPPGDESATFYYLVRQWPETFCETQGCPRQPTSAKWTIHGLWPNYNKSGFPENCPGGTPAQFQSGDIDSIADELSDVWPSYKGSNEDFWKHEYNAHGTCNINDLDEVDYFKAVLELNNEYPIDEYLERAGIVPSDTVTYEASAIENALAGPFGAKPEVMCACPRGGWRTTCDTAKIDSILICVDKTLKIGDCTYDCEGEGCERTNCNTVQYLPLRPHGRLNSIAGNSTRTELL